MSAPQQKFTPGRDPSAAVMGTYARQNLVFERGEGSWLIAADGTRYLDFTSGIAVNTLGHAHPRLIEALSAQAAQLWHTSNLYRVAGQEKLGEMLVAATFADQVFFTNSGTEAIEGAIKTARRYHYVNGNPERQRIITFKGAFHGRTLTALSAAGNEKHLEGCGDPAGGFDHVELNDLSSVEAVITAQTGAIMLEPILGEGGIRSASIEFMQGLRALCDSHGLLLILDEIQSGVGRTGKLFAHQWAGIPPDIMAIAKGIGGGFPVGAFLATKDAATGMTPGSHGSTFGGNPLAVAVGAAVLEVVLEPGFLETVEQRALRLKQEMARLKDQFPDLIEDIRGKGLLSGIKFKETITAQDVVLACAAQNILTVGAADNVMRILPPLNVSGEEISEAAHRIELALQALSTAAPPPRDNKS